MNFLNPYLFWALLGLAVPVIIHLWHKKKGELLPWAATRWLDEKLFQQARGIRLEDLLLLILRLVLLTFLVLALTQPFFKNKNEKAAKVHLFYPDSFVLENYKFELEEAKRKKESVFWLNGDKITNTDEIPGLSSVQAGINRIAGQLNGQELAEIYLDNRIGQSLIFLPFDYHLNIAFDTLNVVSPVTENNYWTFEPSKKIKMVDTPVASQAIRTRIEVEEKPVQAALKAIEQVYGLTFDTNVAGENYDLVLTGQVDKQNNALQLIFGNEKKFYTEKNIKFLGKSVDDLVFEGSLPEIILDELIGFYGDPANGSILSENQIKNSFVLRQDGKEHTESKLASLMFLVFLGVLVVERWLAYR